jgi:hypothetical protein
MISIPEQIARRRVFRKGFDELSGRPFSRRMRCNIEVDDLASVMQQDYETVQVAEGQCRNGEKVDGGNLLFDQLTNLLVDLRTHDRRLGLPSPVELESLPLPFDDGLRFDNDQDLPPILPELQENHPEESIPPMQLRPVNFPVEDGQLLTQGEILCRECFSWRDEAPDEPKESGDEGHKCEANHRKKDEPDDQAEWLMISLTATISRPDEVFGRDTLTSDGQFNLSEKPRI